MGSSINIHQIVSVEIKKRYLSSGKKVTAIDIITKDGASTSISLFSDHDLHITKLNPKVK